jgi:hypothetical protein
LTGCSKEYYPERVEGGSQTRTTMLPAELPIRSLVMGPQSSTRFIAAKMRQSNQSCSKA